MISEYNAILDRDPAATKSEAFLMPGLYAITVHKYISHPLYLYRARFFARLISQIMRRETGIEIHPGAKIGKWMMIDHGMGVVIGETAIIGDNVSIFHGVTLGGTGKERWKRHPTTGDNVTIGAGSTLLWSITVGDNVTIGASTLISGKDVPSNVTVVGNIPRIVSDNGKKVNRLLKKEK